MHWGRGIPDLQVNAELCASQVKFVDDLIGLAVIESCERVAERLQFLFQMTMDGGVKMNVPKLEIPMISSGTARHKFQKEISDKKTDAPMMSDGSISERLRPK
eukprot:8360486-Pyramimonas_sp.AAC.1